MVFRGEAVNLMTNPKTGGPVMYFSESLILRRVISSALKARYLGQLVSQNLCPLGSPVGPVIPPGTGCSFSSPSTIRMSYAGTIHFPGPTLDVFYFQDQEYAVEKS